MELRYIFDQWIQEVGARFADKPWMLSKWEVIEGIEWPPEKIAVMFKTILQGLQPAAHHLALDLGCGPGWILKGLQPYCRKIIGMDISVEMLKQAVRHVSVNQLYGGETARLPFKDAAFDRILSYFVFINTIDEAYFYRSLQQIYRGLKKGGRALIGQLPDETGSAAYDTAKRSYLAYCQTHFSLGANYRERHHIPQKLYNRLQLMRFLEREGIVYEIHPAFNPFYRLGEPETVNWRFDLVMCKPV
jgi:ubiquinone/menaquinone biosynthesis C-methylase UbiE